MPLGNPHLPAGYVQIPIDELSPLRVTVESERFGTQPVYLGKPVYVPVNQTITVTVSKLDGPYRGIMARLEGGDLDTDVSDGIMLDFGERDLQYIQICADGVSLWNLIGSFNPCDSCCICRLTCKRFPPTTERRYYPQRQ
jgi:hypothetical protein